MPAFSKPLADVTADDLNGLITDSWIEDETLEFKQTLSAAGGKSDKWVIDQSEIGQTAKRDLLAEVVAMANSYGGDVILGVEETDEKPPRAKSLHPLPKCVGLASRLELAARDLIRPQIPMLNVRGVPVTDDGAGIVIFRVPKSRSAPHRLEIKGMEKECYRRVSDRSETMSMREIQDLTFASARGLDRVTAKIESIRSEFKQWMDDANKDRRMGYAVIATPLSSDIFVQRVHGNVDVQPTSYSFKVRSEPKLQPLDFTVINEAYDWRPILRGTQAVLEGAYSNVRRVTCEGDIVQFHRITASPRAELSGRDIYQLYPGWVFNSVLNCFESIERFRAAAGAAAVQYAVAITVVATEPVPVSYLSTGLFNRAAGSFNRGDTQFPLYQLGDPDSWIETFRIFWFDFFNAIGVDPRADDPQVDGW